MKAKTAPRTQSIIFLILSLFFFSFFHLFQYLFKDGEETELCMAPHGNRKNKKDNMYYRTQSTTMAALKYEVKMSGAKKTCNTAVFQKAGGSLNSRSMSEDPRNQQQARSLKHRYHHEQLKITMTFILWSCSRRSIPQDPMEALFVV